MNLENNIVIFKTDDNQIAVDVRFYDESVWLTLDQMAALFERDKSTISRHIKNIYKEGELVQEATVAKFATVQTEGEREVERTYDYFCGISSKIFARHAVQTMGNKTSQ